VSELTVAIVGAGLGGLALAQLLDARGVPMRVYERDAALDGPGRSVRIHCRPFAFGFLDGCPEPARSALLAGQGRPDARHLYLDERLELVSVDERPQPELVLDTLTTRRTLALGLGERLLLGKELVALERRSQGWLLRFADGTAAEAAVVVGADGAGSSTRRFAVAPPELRDALLWSVYGNLDLNAYPNEDLLDALDDGFVIVVGEEAKVALAVYEPADPDALRAVGVEPRRYLFWNVLGPPELFGGASPPWGLEPAALLDGLVELLRPFAPWLLEIVARSSPHSVGFLPLQTSLPAPGAPEASFVLIGDAAHPMLPAGLSAAVAFEDARRLVDILTGPAPAGALADLRSDAFARVREAETLAAPGFGLEWLLEPAR
jgi:2-polyprenyl-6-methoxyphenol hydroxylase-like FAD-dependent oxidoreductase